jgi:hypothetical protein
MEPEPDQNSDSQGEPVKEAETEPIPDSKPTEKPETLSSDRTPEEVQALIDSLHYQSEKDLASNFRYYQKDEERML